MNVGIIGWYGTETIGDRAILFGIAEILNRIGYNFEIHLGSLYPFFTERTVKEDQTAYNLIGNLKAIQIYNLYEKLDRYDLVVKSDFVIVGGGPLMDLRTIDIIINIQRMTHDLEKLFFIVGCGVGPLKIPYFKNKVVKLCGNSDYVMVRDRSSAKYLLELGMVSKRVKVIPDPAILAAIIFNQKINEHYTIGSKYYAINLRKYQNHFERDSLYTAKDFAYVFDRYINKYNDVQVVFVPMHNFAIGGDDRIYLNEVKQIMHNDVIVINRPLSMFETFSIFRDAVGCVGMRYHSILLQTVLNGNNAILDYTDGEKGKIHSFVSEYDENKFYAERICLLQDEKQKKEGKIHDVLDFLMNGEKFRFSVTEINKKFDEIVEEARRGSMS